MPVELDATVAATPRDSPVDATATAAGTSARLLATDGGALAIGAGSRLAHFEIVRPLGHGGMGEVYLANDLALDRRVALKLLPAAVARDPSRRERLVREARAQARLNHANVGHLYFIGEDLGHLFFAMEYIDGETLAQRLERGPIPPDEAVELARMAALGLREAFRHGFTHRDIKPSNLMIDGHGVLKVMDFGLVTSNALTDDAESDDAGVASMAASALVGTPLYMAPEQAQGRAVDHRADIYALGATLHHMIAGAPPFAGGSAAELRSQHESASRGSLIARAGRRAVGMIDAVIARMMAKRPIDRPASYDEVIGELERANPARSRPAGFWPRAVAAGIDAMASAFLAIPGAILLSSDGNPWIVLYGLVIVPLVIARFATTAGHALLDLEIIQTPGEGRPTLGRAIVRTFAQLGPLTVGVALERNGSRLDLDALEVAGGILIAIGLLYPPIELARASFMASDARTLWDRAGGTRVRYRVRSAARTVFSSK